MVEELNRLLNTLNLVETRGESTELMADCKRYLRQLIANAVEAKEEADTKVGD